MKKSVIKMLALGALAFSLSAMANAAPISVSIGDFTKSNDGWEMISDPNDPTGGQYYSLNRVNAGGSTWIKMTWSPWDYSEDSALYAGWAPCLRKNWDASNQANLFDLSQPVSFIIEYGNPQALMGYLEGAPWNYYMMAGFADEPLGADGKQVFHMAGGGWFYWPNAPLTLKASDFGVSNATFASMNHFQINMCGSGNSAGYESWSRNSADPVSVMVKSFRMEGVSGEPSPIGDTKKIPDSGIAATSGVVTTAVPSNDSAPYSITLGDFQLDTDGWTLGGDGASPRSLDRVNVNGRYFLKGTLTGTSADPINYDGYLLLQKGWDATGQAAKFDTTKPVNLILDTHAWGGEEPWYYEIQASFADEAGSPTHTTPMWWMGSTLTLTGSNFGVSNAVFASMKNLVIVISNRAAERSWDGPYAIPVVAGCIDNVRLAGTSAPAASSVSIGNFDVDSDGWVLGGSGDSQRSTSIVNINGTNYITLTLSPTSTDPLAYSGHALLFKTWDASTQTSKFDTAYPVQLAFDFKTPSTIWYFSMDGWFANDPGIKHTTGWFFWPAGNMRFSASDFGVSNEVFASLNGLNVIINDFAATNGSGAFANANLTLAFSNVRLEGKAQTGVSSFYIEDPKRSGGIRVVKSGYTATPGSTATIIGKVGTLASGERCIYADTIDSGAGTPVAPLAMNNKSLGGGQSGLQAGVDGGNGLSTIGLLTKTTGFVDNSWGNSFYLYDGSGVKVKAVVSDVTILPAVGSYVAVTGISSIEKDVNGSAQRLIYVTDITSVNP